MSDTNNNTVRRYVHSPITIEHNGINASIQINGKINLSKGHSVAGAIGDDIEYDEIEIPASLVFKLASLLKATRKIEYVNVSENVKS